jgi:hypothetical protein
MPQVFTNAAGARFALVVNAQTKGLFLCRNEIVFCSPNPPPAPTSHPRLKRSPPGKSSLWRTLDFSQQTPMKKSAA